MSDRNVMNVPVTPICPIRKPVRQKQAGAHSPQAVSPLGGFRASRA